MHTCFQFTKSAEHAFVSGCVCSQVLFAVKTLGQSHSAGEPREKTFSVQFRLFGPVLQKGTICLGLALFSPLWRRWPLSCTRWEVLSKTQVTCLTVWEHAPVCFMLLESGNICYFKEVFQIWLYAKRFGKWQNLLQVEVDHSWKQIL